ncbi:PIN domain-containing protein [Agrobacterium tumefaciens]|uniref:PIN domain-containing protein n=1 Tax=Agrobacterium TaxID=357 RepID=UPI00115F3D2A|nr:MULTISPECIES: PIN domain-containing protein [Agrobacterium]MDA5244675.1 PIN domain-containing protein [Agrobacterium sp. MAFF310724]MDA5245674.1 PIN domain-containing protein [Agrobacterium sp. MAFF210268]TRB19019.1 PIN domain-containing protein [Agrobacterium tumefaciens]
MSKAPFVDTNILVYASTSDPRSEVANTIISQPFVISVQALNEFSVVARKKLRMEWSGIRSALEDFRTAAVQIVPLDVGLHMDALDLVQRYNVAFYDALMLAAALKAESNVFLSEDMQDGLTVEGRMKIVNPFTAPLHA